MRFGYLAIHARTALSSFLTELAITASEKMKDDEAESDDVARRHFRAAKVAPRRVVCVPCGELPNPVKRAIYG